MHGVENYREALGRLQASWDTLTLPGQLTGSAAEMSGTREILKSSAWLRGGRYRTLGIAEMEWAYARGQDRPQ